LRYREKEEGCRRACAAGSDNDPEAPTVEERPRVSEKISWSRHRGKKLIQCVLAQDRAAAVEDAQSTVVNDEDLRRPDRQGRVGWNASVKGQARQQVAHHEGITRRGGGSGTKWPSCRKVALVGLQRW